MSLDDFIRSMSDEGLLKREKRSDSEMCEMEGRSYGDKGAAVPHLPTNFCVNISIVIEKDYKVHNTSFFKRCKNYKSPR